MTAKVGFGIQLPASSKQPFERIASLAQKCEEAGFDSIWVPDHVMELNGWGVYEPLTLLATLASVTKKVRLGTGVLVAPLRNPILLADVLATIQKISNNRMIIGVGVGWNKPEFRNLGVEFTQRGGITDEMLDLIDRLWGSEGVSYNGSYFQATDVTLATRPKSRPPIWIGGNSPAAIERASKHDGWFPIDITPADLSRGRKSLQAHGRRNPNVALFVQNVLKKEEARGGSESRMTKAALDWCKSKLREYVDSGTNYFVISVPIFSQDPSKDIESVAECMVSL